MTIVKGVARLEQIQKNMRSMMKSSMFHAEETAQARILDELRETQFAISELAEAVLVVVKELDSR